jgi:hypothetical protein
MAGSRSSSGSMVLDFGSEDLDPSQKKLTIRKLTTSVEESKIFLSASAPDPALESFIKYLENVLFDLSNRIEIATIYKTFFIKHDFFYRISSSLW